MLPNAGVNGNVWGMSIRSASIKMFGRVEGVGRMCWWEVEVGKKLGTLWEMTGKGVFFYSLKECIYTSESMYIEVWKGVEI